MIDDRYKLIFTHIPKTAGSSVTNIIKRAPGKNSNKPENSSNNNYRRRHDLTIEDYKNLTDTEIFDEYFKFSIVRNPWDRFASVYNFFMIILGKDQHFRNFGWERIKNPIPEHTFTRLRRGHLPPIERRRLLDKSNYKLLSFEEFVYKFKDTFIDKNQEYKANFKEDSPNIVPIWAKTQIEYLSIDGKIIMDDFCKFENLQEDIERICKKINLPYPSTFPHIRKNEHLHYTELYDEKTKKIVGDIYGEEIELFKYTFK